MKQPITVAPDALDFASLIRPGETVGWAELTAEPVLLTEILDAQAGRCGEFRVFSALILGNALGADHENLRVGAIGGGAGGGRFFARGAAEVMPANISQMCELIARGSLRIDILLLQVTGPDAAGRYNAGVGIDYLHEAIGAARLVIAQINDELPWTEGDTVVEGGAFDIIVPAAYPVLEIPSRPVGPVEAAIGAHIARLVPDRATLELGFGAIPDATTQALGSKRGLGIHSGAVGDGVLDLIEAGVVDNRHKEIDPGVSVAMLLLGTRRLYRWADRNPMLRVRSPRYTHDSLPMSHFRRFVAINSALEVDLTGQVNAETASGRHVGTVGGQMDFVRAANRAPEGRSIIALPAASRDRRRTRIVARLGDAVVTTPRAEADCIVTEHGIAELKGRTLAERARAMIAIADPAFRAELEKAAETLV